MVATAIKFTCDSGKYPVSFYFYIFYFTTSHCFAAAKITFATTIMSNTGVKTDEKKQHFDDIYVES